MKSESYDFNESNNQIDIHGFTYEFSLRNKALKQELIVF